MPNHIKNRIEINGTNEQIEAVLNKFSTAYPKEPNKSYDGDLIYKNKKTGSVGWLDEKTGLFSQREKETTTAIPEGFEQDYNEAWVRFPDFNKIIEMPESLNITSDNFLMPLENKFSVHNEFKNHLDDLKKFCDNNPERKQETVDNFIAGIKNYINYGYATWHSWSSHNWGTKWNCYNCAKISENIFEFDTAWSGVPNLIELSGPI